MRRQFCVLLALSMLTAVLSMSPAGSQNGSDHGFVTAWVVDAAFTDVLGRHATSAEHDHWDAALNLTNTELDLHASLLGTRTFFRSSGRNMKAFIRAVYQHAEGREPSVAEVRSARVFVRNTKGSPAAKRRKLARQVLTASAYDADGFTARRVIVDRSADGTLRRVGLLFARPVDPTATSLQVAIDGELVPGRIVSLRGGRLLSLIPSEAQKLSGRVVASATTNDGPIPLRAEDTTKIDPIFDSLFPSIRLVANYGNHQTRLLGVLGETGPVEAARRVKLAAAPFSEPGRPAVGAFELIATVAQGSAGADGNYSAPSHLEDLKVWIDVAAAEGLYVILDIQPGRSDFIRESKRYESLLLEPHVGLALDPEWRMKPHQRPGQVVGQVSAAEVNAVSQWLSDLVIDHDLPEKPFIIHQFQSRMITDRQDLIDRPGLATIIHADGFGGQSIKLQTYSIIHVEEPFWNGFKLFIDEDTNMFTPQEVLAFTGVPVPDLITYQ